MEPFCEHDTPEDVAHTSCARVMLNGPGYSDSERSSQLLQLIDLAKCDCSPQQLEHLKTLLSEHSNAFEVDKSELGHTNVVKHMIDTGSSKLPLLSNNHNIVRFSSEGTSLPILIKQMQNQGILF